MRERADGYIMNVKHCQQFCFSALCDINKGNDEHATTIAKRNLFTLKLQEQSDIFAIVMENGQCHGTWIL